MMNSEYLAWIIIFIGAVLLVLKFLWNVQKKGLRESAIALIVEVEELIGSGHGEQKMNAVIDKLIALIPAPFSLIISRETVRKFIQGVFDEIKAALDYRPTQE